MTSLWRHKYVFFYICFLFAYIFQIKHGSSNLFWSCNGPLKITWVRFTHIFCSDVIWRHYGAMKYWDIKFSSDYISETKQDRSISIWSWERSSVTASKRFRIIFARTSLWRHIALFPIDLCISACISESKQHSSNLISPLYRALNIIQKRSSQMTLRWGRNPICSFDSCRLRRSLCVLPFPFHDYSSDRKQYLSFHIFPVAKFHWSHRQIEERWLDGNRSEKVHFDHTHEA